MADASVIAIDGRAVVRVGGSELLAPVSAKAGAAAALAVSARDEARDAADTALATTRYFPTRSAGEAGSATGQAFAIKDGSGTIVYYEKQASGSIEISRSVSPSSLAAGGGAAMIGSAGRAPGINRSQQQINDEGLTLKKDFGAIGDNSADDTTALQNAFATCGEEGFALRDRGGTYRISEAIGGAVRPIAADGHGFGFGGAGRNATVFIYDGDPAEPAVHLTGNMPAFDHLYVGGFAIRPPADLGVAGLGSAGGIRLENFSGFTLSDVDAFRVGNPVHLIGCLNGRIDTLVARYCRRDIVMERGSYLSSPNTIEVSQYRSLSALERAIVNQDGCLLDVHHFGIEGLGEENTNPGNVRGIEALFMGREGGLGFNLHQGYFENYSGTPVYIQAGDNLVDYKIAATFNRLGGNARINSEVVFNGNALGVAANPQRLDVSGSVFATYQGYQNVQSSPKPFLQLGTANGWAGLTFIDRETLYPKDTNERPQIPPTVRHIGVSDTEVFATFTDAGDLVRSEGIVSARWREPGFAEFTLPRSTDALTLHSFAPNGVAANIFGAGPGTPPNSIVIATQRTNGAFESTTFSFAGTYRQ